MDIPGLNPIAIEKMLRATQTTCNTFRSAPHGNARPRTTGESIRCLTCHDTQGRHWLRQAAISADEWRRQTVELQQTIIAWALAADERDRKQEQIERLLAALNLAESVYRLNCVAPGEPSSVLAAMQAAIAAVGA